MTLVLIPAIHRATHQIGLSLTRGGGPKVTQAEAHILAHLHAHGDATVGELHRAFGHRRSTLTSILDRLAGRGLVTRESSERDRRTFVVRLTRPGHAAAAAAYERLRAIEAAAVAGLSKRALDALVDALAAVERAADEG